MKHNLKDVTFIIPVRIDSVIRLENLLLSINYLESNFDSNFIIIEASNYNNNLIKSLISPRILYFFVEDNDPIFHRTKYINIASSHVETSITGIWDADVIIENSQIIEAAKSIQNDGYDVAIPYDGTALDISDILRNYYCINKDIEFLKKNKSKMKLLYSNPDKPCAVGGAFLISTEKYRAAGLENEGFYGWGPEDFERYSRWLGLKYKIFRSNGCLFHLSHPRFTNSGANINTFEMNRKKDILNLLHNYTKEELDKYIANINGDI